jgi:uncharacterized protein YwgA/O-acetyl-ADP-ribose deacetylase (regulator of RNase III)
MITVVQEGDLFTSKAQTWVNTVNTVGVMGKGIALGFKKRFPEMFEDYADRCRRKEVKLGEPYLFRQEKPPWIINFPTKSHWRTVARLTDITEGLEYLEAHFRKWGVDSMAVPPLGCGEGGLEWRVVGPTLYSHLKRLEIPVELYAPFGTPYDELQPSRLEQLALDLDSVDVATPASRVPTPWLALVEILNRLYAQPYRPPVGRISWQKVAYFATRAGIPTGLQYDRGSYGPYSPDLKPMNSKLVNNGLVTEVESGRMIRIDVGPTFGRVREAYSPELARWNDQIDRVTDLMARMNTRASEIAATVMYSADELQQGLRRRPTEAEVVESVKQWKQRRKPQVDEAELAEAVRSLGVLGWLSLEPTADLLVEVDEFIDA